MLHEKLLMKAVLDFLVCFSLLNPLTPMSDQDRISLQYQYNINQVSDEN